MVRRSVWQAKSDRHIVSYVEEVVGCKKVDRLYDERRGWSYCELKISLDI